MKYSICYAQRGLLPKFMNEPLSSRLLMQGWHPRAPANRIRVNQRFGYGTLARHHMKYTISKTVEVTQPVTVSLEHLDFVVAAFGKTVSVAKAEGS